MESNEKMAALIKAAKLIAEYANECCHRIDGYEKDVEEFALQEMLAAIEQQPHIAKGE